VRQPPRNPLPPGRRAGMNADGIHFIVSGGHVADKDASLTTTGVSATEDFKSPITRALLEYWNARRGDRPYPAWTDIHLMDLYRIAPHVVVRDVVDDGREFRCRFSGTRVEAVLGVHDTGRLLSETYSARGAEIIKLRYAAALEAKGPVRAVGYVRAVEKNLPTGFEVIYLPLAGADGAIGHVIAAYDFDYEPAPEEATPPA